MGEGRHFKDLQQPQKKLDQISQIDTMKREAVEINLQEQISELKMQLLGTQLQLLNTSRGKAVANDEESTLGFTNHRLNNSEFQLEKPQNQVIRPILDLDFPTFDGSHPRVWILKCNGYFKFMPNLPDSRKVDLACMHFEGKAAQWLQNYGIMQLDLTWNEFMEMMSARFEDLREGNIIAEFNKLSNTGSYDEYVERFEELRACMLLISKIDYSEGYFVASFLSGLSEELRSFVSMFKPTTLLETVDLGRKSILALESITRKLNGSSISIKLLTSAEMAERMEKNLCYNCDEPFVFGHRCKEKICYVLMTEEEELSHLQNMEYAEESLDSSQNAIEEEVKMNAGPSENAISIMRLIGEVEGQKLDIVIGSGSEVSFISEEAAERLKCTVVAAEPLVASAVNGKKMVSTRQAVGLKWKMQGHEFVHSPRLWGIKGYDMILGVDWLASCSPVECNYSKMTFIVTSPKGKRVKLQGITSNVGSKMSGDEYCLSMMLHHS